MGPCKILLYLYISCTQWKTGSIGIQQKDQNLEVNTEQISSITARKKKKLLWLIIDGVL